MSHTPGPWITSVGHPGLVLYPERPGFYIQLGSGKFKPSDARLIACAPELLAMLAECRDYLVESLNSVIDDNRPRYERQRQLIRDDIAKLDALIDRAGGGE